MDVVLCPYVRTALYMTMPKGWHLQERVIFDYELLYIKEGHARVTIEDEVYQAAPGDLFLFRPKQRHSLRTLANDEIIQPHIHFDLTYSPDREAVPINFTPLEDVTPAQQQFFREDVLDAFLPGIPGYFRPENPLYIEQLLFDVIQAYESGSIGGQVSITQRFLRLWEQLLTEMSYRTGRTRTRESTAAMIKRYLEQNDTVALSLAQVEQSLHFSVSYINRIFQESYHTSPMRYHTMLRVQKAKRMIRYTNMSLTEIASATGFDSLQDFSRVFRKVDGRPPSACREHVPRIDR